MEEDMGRVLSQFGWHFEILTNVSESGDLLKELVTLEVDIVFDHMGFLSTSKGTSNAGFRTLVSLLKDGDCWVKLSAPYRLTCETSIPYRDVLPFVHELCETNSERLVWATDWPHTELHIPMPNDGDLVDLLEEWVPAEDRRYRILVTNPNKLYDFGP